MKIVCLDFETANNFKCSTCSAGLAVIENGKITKKNFWLVKPHIDYLYFNPVNIMLHGIDETKVKNAPEFDFVYSQIKEIINNSLLVAHNAKFDNQVLCETLDLYNIRYPKLDFLCTYKIALKTWIGLENFKLNTICNYLGFNFEHHNAQNDAVACGKVLLAALEEKNVSTVEELIAILGIEYEGIK